MLIKNVLCVCLYFLALLCTFLIFGCYDTVRTEFKTLDDAEKARAFERGWLPPFLPSGSTDIVEINDLDSNCGHGSFNFPEDSLQPYIENVLKSMESAVIRKSQNGYTIEVSKEKYQWVIELFKKGNNGTYKITSKSH